MNTHASTFSEQSYLLEKLTYKGAQTLSDKELLALMLSLGSPKESHMLKAKNLLERYSNLTELLTSPNIAGISNKASVMLKCSAELARRIKATENIKPSLENSDEADALIRELLKDAKGEEFWVVCLNRSLKVIDQRCIFRGGLSSSVVDIKLLVKYVLDNLSSAVILAHNHPSGSLEPSEEDINLTNKITKALELFDITCLDHIITAGVNTYSFRKNQLIK